MNHYFKNNEDLKSKTEEFVTKFFGIEYRITTDLGVFSRRKIDFGTRLLLESIELNNPQTIIDLGCGYGIVGIVLAKRYPSANLILLDINNRGLELSLKNIRSNNISNAVVKHSNALDEVAVKADVIVTNPPVRAGKDVVFKFYEDSFLHLNNDGELFVVIQKKQGASSSLKKLYSLFGNVTVITKKAGYFVIKAKKEK